MPTEAQIEAAAAAIANARGGRRGMPPVTNILEMLPVNLVDEVREDARAALEAAEAGPSEWPASYAATITGYGHFTLSGTDEFVRRHLATMTPIVEDLYQRYVDDETAKGRPREEVEREFMDRLNAAMAEVTRRIEAAGK